MAGNPLPPLPLDKPMLDRSGLLTRAWSAWFIEMVARVGGSRSSTNSQLLALIQSLQTENAGLRLRLEAVEQGRAL